MKPIYIELATVAAAISLGEATIQRLVRNGDFPRPRQLSGRRVAWLVPEVEEWAESRPASDLAPPPNTAAPRKSAGGAPAPS